MRVFVKLKTVPFLIVFFVCFVVSASSEANENLWVIGITGGGGLSNTVENFYIDAGLFYKSAQAIGVKQDRQFMFFGASAPGQLGYFRETQAEKNSTKQIINEFRKNTKNCALAAPLFENMKHQGEREYVLNNPLKLNLFDLDANGHSDINGHATWKNFSTALDSVIDKAKSGEHLLLNLTDHGSKLETFVRGEEWVVDLGDKGKYIYLSALKEYLHELQKKGVIVHLNVQACYSGGFNKLTDSTDLKAGVCTTSMSDGEQPSYGADQIYSNTFDYLFHEAMAKYHNQLSAFACALAQDAINQPMSSLDDIVRDWKAKQTVDHAYCTVTYVDNMGGLKEQIGSYFSASQKNKFRQKLITAYKKHFVTYVEKCKRKRSDDEIFRKNLLQCVDDDRAGLNPKLRGYFRAFFSMVAGDDYSLEMINNHVGFLEKAPLNKLSEFKSALCCLSYNLKTRKAPGICQE